MSKRIDAFKMTTNNWWYIPRGTKRFPQEKHYINSLYEKEKSVSFIKRWILDGYLPGEPKFDNNSVIFTMGSCFAENLSKSLEKYQKQKNPITLHTPSSVNNTFGILQFFRWVLTGDVYDGYWHEDDANEWMSDWTREKFEENIKKSNGFVFTLGLSEIWKDKETNTVFWRSIPSHIYKKDEDRYEFTLSTVDENTKNIKELIELIKKYVGDVPIILTVSPVPLKSTFRNVSCITANTVSKSILRVSVDNIMNMNYDNIFYWPSYEIVKELSPHIEDGRTFEIGALRHPREDIVDIIIDSFYSFYFKK